MKIDILLQKHHKKKRQHLQKDGKYIMKRIHEGIYASNQIYNINKLENLEGHMNCFLWINEAHLYIDVNMR